MAQRLVSDAIWSDITKLAKAAAVRRAAIAYVTDLTSIRFRAGDTLVVDASNNAIASGSTDASTLSKVMSAGTDVYSIHGLHAKVIRLDNIVVVGSGNLSRRSRDELIEAAIISDDEKLVAQVDAFIDALCKSGTRLTEKSIERLLRIPVVQRTGSGGIREHDVPTTETAVWILGLPEMDVDADEEAVAQQMIEVEREEGRDVEVNEFYWQKTGRFAKLAKAGDLVISVYRPTYSDRSPGKIKVFRPMWIKRIIPGGKNRDVGFVTAMPKSIAREKLAWPRFRTMAALAGVSVKPDGGIQLTAGQWSRLRAQWMPD